jgi:hypothetical protein
MSEETKPVRVSEKTEMSLPLKNLLGLIAATATAVWAYFGVIERLNKLETNNTIMLSDLEKNTEFRIKWPRGDMGSLPADSEQFMLIENLYKAVDKINLQLESSQFNKVNIEFLQQQMEKALDDIEKLKDANREMKYSNGN